MEQNTTTMTRLPHLHQAQDIAPLDGPSGDLLRRARGWGAVARDAHETQKKQEEAMEILRRRNQKGGQ
jgi:hypothetical protein